MTPMYCLITVKGTHKTDFKLLPSDPSQPRIYEIGAALLGRRGHTKLEFCSLIKPDGWSVASTGDREKNKSITEDCHEYGVDIRYALSAVSLIVAKSECVLFYNKVTDLPLMHIEQYHATGGSDMIWNPGKPISEMANTIKEINGLYDIPSLAQAINLEKGRKVTDHSAAAYLANMRALLLSGIMENNTQ